jgi:hypothetical protein
MILQALHTTLNPIVPAYPLIGDIEATTPFCMYKADAAPIRDKSGIVGYTYTVSIGIVDVTIESVNTLTESITAAIAAMSGTINNTEIKSVLQTDESGIYYADTDKVYINDLEFKFYTNNR